MKALMAAATLAGSADAATDDAEAEPGLDGP